MLNVDAWIQFSQLHPFPPGWPADMVRRFLTQLVSSDALVYERGAEAARVAGAVLLDRVRNPGRNASLEILGLRADADPRAELEAILAWAKTCVPDGFRGFEVAFPSAFAPRVEIAHAQGLESYYETFGMLHESPATVAPPPAGVCTIVTDRDEAELFDVLRATFAENIDTSIPDFEVWQAARRAPSRSKTWGVWKEKRLVSFLNLVVPRESPFAEIRTLGTLAECRGKGLATALIQRALGYVAQLEIPSCALTVATRNARALKLYRRLGFRELEHQHVYRWVKPGAASDSHAGAEVKSH